jgi:hypothetical protein
VATDWALVAVDDARGHALYTGRFEMMQLLTGEAPFKTPGQGVLAFDANGDPVPGPLVSLRFALTVPLGTAPVGGWPVATYGHGAGGDYQSFVRSEGVWAAEAGVAMLSMDNPMNGERDPEGGDFEQYLTTLAMSNVAAGRDMYRHGIVDHVQLARLAKNGLQVPATLSHTGAAIDLDASRLQYVGHSMGSQIGAMLIAVEPDLGAAFLSEGGGSAAAALLYRKSGGVDIEGLLAVLLDVDTDDEPLDADHPVVGLLLQTLLDPGDPLSYAYGAIRDPNGAPRSIVMTEGLLDDQTLPVTIESLAAAFGLPIAEPVAQASAAHALWGIDATPLPVSGNVTVGPTPVTGALLQFPDQGHFALYRVPSLQAQLRAWLASVAAGSPVLASP